MYKKIIKNVAFIFIAGSLSVSAYAVDAGLYMGLMAGAATNSAKKRQVQAQCTAQNQAAGLCTPGTAITATPSSNQAGVRAFLGYQINPYAGFESGVSGYSAISYKTTVPPVSSLRAVVGAFDIVGKGSFPLGSFDVYAKGGGALAYLVTSAGLNGSSKRRYNYKVAPTYSFGASYAFTPNWVADVSWNRLMIGGTFGNISMYALGISYHFVDRFCGQFLCDD